MAVICVCHDDYPVLILIISGATAYLEHPSPARASAGHRGAHELLKQICPIALVAPFGIDNFLFRMVLSQTGNRHHADRCDGISA